MREVIMSYTLDDAGKMINMKQVGELVRCEDCIKKPFCHSQVAMIDKYRALTCREDVEYCSIGKRRNDDT